MQHLIKNVFTIILHYRDVSSDIIVTVKKWALEVVNIFPLFITFGWEILLFVANKSLATLKLGVLQVAG